MAYRQINYKREIEATDRGIAKLKARAEKLEERKKFLELMKMEGGQS